jgi:hypothetical protein
MKEPLSTGRLGNSINYRFAFSVSLITIYYPIERIFKEFLAGVEFFLSIGIEEEINI